MLRSWKSYNIVLESHGKVIELNNAYRSFYVAAKSFVSWGLRPTVTETDESLEFDIQYYLLQIKHR